tara:strand:+ start:6191 stop:6847 length:657 start_codon:yes stop_codon:yes gene_type:complete
MSLRPMRPIPNRIDNKKYFSEVSDRIVKYYDDHVLKHGTLLQRVDFKDMSHRSLLREQKRLLKSQKGGYDFMFTGSSYSNSDKIYRKLMERFKSGKKYKNDKVIIPHRMDNGTTVQLQLKQRFTLNKDYNIIMVDETKDLNAPWCSRSIFLELSEKLNLKEHLKMLVDNGQVDIISNDPLLSLMLSKWTKDGSNLKDILSEHEIVTDEMKTYKQDSPN